MEVREELNVSEIDRDIQEIYLGSFFSDIKGN